LHLGINSECIQQDETSAKEKSKVTMPVIDFSKRSQARTVLQDHPFKPTHFFNNSHNELQAVRARVVCKTPKPSKEYLQFYRTTLLKNLHILFPGVTKVKSVSVSEYLRRSNASPEVKAMLLQTYLKLQKEGINENTPLSKELLSKWTYRKSFIKVENALYRSLCGLKHKAPRLISGAQPEFTILVGPWIMAVQDAIKRIWRPGFPIVFSSGLNGEQIGKWAKQNQKFGHIVEDDVGKFDASCDKHILKTEAMMFDKFGAPVAVSQLMHANVNTRGKTRFGIKYKVPGGRKSGDPYTSLGNSIINACTHLFSFMLEFKCTIQYAMQHMRMIVQGDDNVLFIRSKKFNLKKHMLKFGFDAYALHRDSLFRTSFCSARFLPVKDGVILSPKPGRVLAKLGTFVNAAQRDPKTMLEESVIGVNYNLGHIPGVTEYLKSTYKLDMGKPRPKANDWEIFLTKVHQPTAETKFWLEDTYKYWPKWIDLKDAHMERIFELDTDGPKLFFHH
jgi:hypothetical protein